MKKIRLFILSTLCIITYPSVAQQLSPAAQEVRNEIWGVSDTDFSATAVPEKWNQESAVILGRSFRFEYGLKRGLREIYKRIYLRERVKLVDKAAVEEYSEFKFQQIDKTWGEKLYFGIKVIKTDGTEKVIPLSESVKMQTQQGNNTSYYQKLAIPDLVPGDIIDYYIFSKQLLSATTTSSLPPRTIPLMSTYPIVRQKIVLAIDPYIYLNARAYNQAPDFLYDEEEDLYILRDGNREKLEAPQWFYENRSVPILKFQVFFKEIAFTGKKGKANFAIKKANMLKFAAEFPAKDKTVTSFYKQFRAYLKARKKHKLSNEEKLKEAYYFFRHQYQITTLEKILSLQKLDMKQLKLEKDFIKIMGYLLTKYKIDYEIVVAVSRKTASLDDWIIPEDLAILLKVNGSTHHFLQNPVFYDFYGEIRPELQGVEGYAIQVNSTPKTVRKIRLPRLGHQYHSSVTHTEVWMNEGMNTWKVKQTVTLKGGTRESYQTFLNDPYEMIRESTLRYDKTEAGKGKVNEVIQQRLAEKRDETFKASLKNEFDVSVLALKQLRVLENGIWDNQPTLKYESEFVLGGIAQKIGSSYIIEAGKLIGKQVDMKTLKKKRIFDIYMAHPRSYKHEITIHLPDGYQVQGLDKLKKELKNQTGGFVSNAQLSGAVLKIQTYKYYSHGYEPLKQWGKMKDFLKVAYQFTQQKLLLKKK
ncbi:MAG TPA: hypothetical protein DCS93_29670 [Microscillaceae bacterium]|nr:hypothetical protein [Microscillaceae bacterium]